MKFYKVTKKTKIMLVKLIADAIVKGLGISCFFVGIVGLAKCPTDPKRIVQVFALFLFGLLIMACDNYLANKQERKK